VLFEQLIHQLPDGCFGRIDVQFLFHPLIAERCLPAERLAHLGPDGNGSSHPGSDLLAFPLRHGGDHCVEESPSRRRRVDRLGEGDKVSASIPEVLGEFEQLFGVPRQPGQLGEDEAAYVAASDVAKHPLGFRVVLDRLPGHGIEAVDLHDLPVARIGVGASTTFVRLGALSADLVFGRHPNPDANTLFLLVVAHGRLPGGQGASIHTN